MTCRSIHVATDVIAEFRVVADPGAILRTLLELYWQGLSTPLHFFPETSRAWMNDGKQRRSHSKARTEWYGGFNKRGEGEELEYKIAHAGLDTLLNEKFEQLAEDVYGPLFEDLELSNAQI